MKTYKEHIHEISYFLAVLNLKIKHITNDKKKEHGVIVSEIQALLNDCSDCAHCLAGCDSATLICTASGNLLGRNQIGCRKKERVIEENCYTHNS